VAEDAGVISDFRLGGDILPQQKTFTVEGAIRFTFLSAEDDMDEKIIASARQFQDLADRSRIEVVGWIKRQAPRDQRGLLIEACRALDYQHVLQYLSNNPAHKMSAPDFDLMIRGFNGILGAVLSTPYDEDGIPLGGGTSESLRLARSLLYKMGTSAALDKAAAMLRHGMADVEYVDGVIHFRMADLSLSDHFLDQVDVWKYGSLDDSHRESPITPDESLSVAQIRERMADLVFPWITSKGRMVGYSGDSELEVHYLSLASKTMSDWKNEAGIHPETDLLGTSGGTLTAVVGIMASGYLKHIHFVDVGCSVLPDINYQMSLTIWKPLSEIAEGLSAFTHESLDAITEVLQRIVVTPADAAFFESANTPYIPLLIQISNLYVLSPISSIYGNPLQGISLLQEKKLPALEQLIRSPREGWMHSELNHLFLGTRYQLIDRPVMLKRIGIVLTDIDAAVFDVTTGTLGVFQLKWQNFGTSDVKKQKSKARNFVDQIDNWVAKVNSWIEDQGLEALGRALQLKGQVKVAKIFAIGRFSARFRSYGYAPSSPSIAVSTWLQFVRLRYEIGPVEDVIGRLHESIMRETFATIEVKPIPYETEVAGTRIVFDNFWNEFNDEKENVTRNDAWDN
jgi:hypothetical protein